MKNITEIEADHKCQNCNNLHENIYFYEGSAVCDSCRTSLKAARQCPECETTTCSRRPGWLYCYGG